MFLDHLNLFRFDEYSKLESSVSFGSWPPSGDILKPLSLAHLVALIAAFFNLFLGLNETFQLSSAFTDGSTFKWYRFSILSSRWRSYFWLKTFYL
jgi:hypothetical protein